MPSLSSAWVWLRAPHGLLSNITLMAQVGWEWPMPIPLEHCLGAPLLKNEEFCYGYFHNWKNWLTEIKKFSSLAWSLRKGIFYIAQVFHQPTGKISKDIRWYPISPTHRKTNFRWQKPALGLDHLNSKNVTDCSLAISGHTSPKTAHQQPSPGHQPKTQLYAQFCDLLKEGAAHWLEGNNGFAQMITISSFTFSWSGS